MIDFFFKQDEHIPYKTFSFKHEVLTCTYVMLAAESIEPVPCDSKAQRLAAELSASACVMIGNTKFDFLQNCDIMWLVVHFNNITILIGAFARKPIIIDLM